MKPENIKFKAKRLDNGEWVEGDLMKEHYGARIIEHTSKADNWIAVNPSTVCQFTGLKDKDGKPIYEGDIVDFGGEGKVVFKGGAFYAKFGKYTECLLSSLVESKESITVVGSEFDRKEGEK